MVTGFYINSASDISKYFCNTFLEELIKARKIGKIPQQSLHW